MGDRISICTWRSIAFVTNVPMSFLEKKIFGRAKKENKIVEKLARPISLFLTIVFAVGVIVLVMFGVIPQLTRTIGPDDEYR